MLGVKIKLNEICNIFFLTIILSKQLFAQKDYFDYHRKIIEAEDCLLKNNFDDAFALYKDVFQKYDFVFSRDCLIAAQFAYYYKKKELALFFLQKGFLQGLKLFHVIRCPVFSKSDLNFFKEATVLFQTNRPIYLKKINADVVEMLLSNRWDDQFYKSINPLYTIINGNVILDTIKTKNMNSFLQICKKYGFPGEKVTGIIDNNTMKELGRNAELDHLARFESYRSKNENKRIDKENFDYNSFDWLSNDIAFDSYIHYPCPFQKLGEPFLMESIKNGSLYPNDYALIYITEHYRPFARYSALDSNQLKQLCPCNTKTNGGYGLVIGWNDTDSAVINQNRKKIGMRSLQLQKDFYFFAKKLDIIVRFGYMEWK